MTMHLASHAYSTISNRKHQPKHTKANVARWTEDCRKHNKLMKRLGEPALSLAEYIDYVHGKRKMPNPAKDRSAFKPYTPPSTPVYRRGDTSHIPSRDSGVGVAAKVEPQRYTGTLVKGIATMHKSNAVPVIDDEQAKDIARMRRG